MHSNEIYYVFEAIPNKKKHVHTTLDNVTSKERLAQYQVNVSE